MAGDALEYVGEPGLGIDAVHLDRHDEAVHGGGALPSAIGAAEQPGLPAQSDPAQRPLRRVVGETNPPVIEEQRERRPALEHVLDRLGEIVPARELRELRAQVDVKILDQRPAHSSPRSHPFLGALAIDRALDLEHRVDAAHDLDGDRRQNYFIFARSFAAQIALDVCELEELASRMRPARRLPDWARFSSRQVKGVVAFISVGLQDAGIPRQMRLRMLAPPIARVIKDRRGRPGRRRTACHRGRKSKAAP